MKTCIVVAVAAALLSSACAQTPLKWGKAGSSQEEFYQDHAACAAQAGAALGGGWGSSDMYAQAVAVETQNNVYKSCMYGKGWHVVP